MGVRGRGGEGGGRGREGKERGRGSPSRERGREREGGRERAANLVRMSGP